MRYPKHSPAKPLSAPHHQKQLPPKLNRFPHNRWITLIMVASHVSGGLTLKGHCMPHTHHIRSQMQLVSQNSHPQPVECKLLSSLKVQLAISLFYTKIFIFIILFLPFLISETQSFSHFICSFSSPFHSEENIEDL
jgi:hypothetical protein